MMKLMSLLVAASLCAVGATVSGEMVFDREQLVLGTADGMTTVSLGRCVSAWETGAPSVPIAVAQLVVPQGMKVVGVTVDALDTETVGEFDVYPVQPARPLSDPGPFEYVPPDPRFYGAVYPGQVATAGHQGSMFGYNIASVFVAPVQYNGTDRILTFHPKVRFTLELEPAELGYLPVGMRTEQARRRLEAQVTSIVMNPEDVGRYAPNSR